MGVIRLQEQNMSVQGANLLLSFGYGTQYPVQIRDPFADDPGQETDLEWYFEEYLRFPFTQDVRARKAAESIQLYGESLFRQIFADPGALATYKQMRQQGLSTLQIEIAGSSAFHRFHWEALADPELQVPLALHVSLVRQNVRPQTFPALLRSSTTLRVLVVVARPQGGRDVGYRTISRPLVEELERTRLPIEVTLLRPGTYQALSKHLEQITRASGVGYYHLIHFDVHGALLAQKQLEQGAQTNRYLYAGRYGRATLAPYTGKKGFLFLEGNQEEQADPVEASELARLLLQYQVPLVLLNACQSGKASADSESTLGSCLIESGVQCVLAMGYSITVSAAELLMKTFYQALFAQRPLSDALCLARQELANQKERRAFFNQRVELEDWLLPIFYQNQPVQLALQPFTPQEELAFYQKKASSYHVPQRSAYGFVGRDLDILQIEKRLLLKCNILLLRGMGGAGKTTLLHYLASWWQRTGLVQEVFYFSYDERAWSRQQILQSIGRKLLDKYEFLTFQSLSLDAQQARLIQLLGSTRSLLILDNLEAITGARLAVGHTISRPEQNALQRLLTDLVGGQTLVLLGSRGAEGWLSNGTFEANCYELAGLDQEAVSQLADRILERQGAMAYRSDPKLPELLQLLNGFPLAVEVVLTNVGQQTPAQVLEALEAGDTRLQVGSSEKRTENILRCVEYSYRNLSPDAQHLLLCLAPFTSAIWQDMLDQYAEHLKRQSALALFPFAKWRAVVRETVQWGLLSADPDLPSFFRIQPILPYFLRQRLASQEWRSFRQAVERAFYEHYTELSEELAAFLHAQEAGERQIALLFIRYEYENLLIALRFAASTEASVIPIYDLLDAYLHSQQDHQRGQELDRFLLSVLERTSWEGITETRKEEWIHVLVLTGNRHLLLKRYEDAQACYEKTLRLIEQTELSVRQVSLWQASTYHQLGLVAQEQRQWEQAEQYYQQVLRISVMYNDRYEQASTYHNLGMVAQKQRRWLEAEQYYQQALQIETEFSDRYGQASTYHQLGMVAQDQRQWEQAAQYYQRALQIKVASHNRYAQASTYHGLGLVAQEQRRWEQAEQYYQQALQIKVEFNDRHGQASTYHNLGLVAQEQRQWEQAEQYYQQALQIKETYHDRYAQASTYHGLGLVAQEQRRWEQAEQYYQQALQIKREFNDRHGQASAYHGLGMVAQHQRQWEQAEQYYQQALQLAVMYNDRYGQASIYHHLGMVALEQRRWEESTEHLLQALHIYIAYRDRYRLAVVLNSLALLWPERKETDLVKQVASLLMSTPEEIEALFQIATETSFEQPEAKDAG